MRGEDGGVGGRRTGVVRDVGERRRSRVREGGGRTGRGDGIEVEGWDWRVVFTRDGLIDGGLCREIVWVSGEYKFEKNIEQLTFSFLSETDENEGKVELDSGDPRLVRGDDVDDLRGFTHTISSTLYREGRNFELTLSISAEPSPDDLKTLPSEVKLIPPSPLP